MTRAKYYEHHRQARLGNLGPLAMVLNSQAYRWFLYEVYDLRHPHVGQDRHAVRVWIAYAGKRWLSPLRASLIQWHNARGWFNACDKSLLRLWTEFKAKTAGK